MNQQQYTVIWFNTVVDVNGCNFTILLTILCIPLYLFIPQATVLLANGVKSSHVIVESRKIVKDIFIGLV